MPRSAKLKFFTAIILACAMLAFMGIFVKVDLVPMGLKNTAKTHSIKLVGDDSSLQHRATDAFFIPTEHNAKYHLHKPEFEEGGKQRNGQIFSELDKIRIFNVFLKNFSESEYWVVSTLNLQPQGGKKFGEKHFIAADGGPKVGENYGMPKPHDCDTQILFKDEPDEY